MKLNSKKKPKHSLTKEEQIQFHQYNAFFDTFQQERRDTNMIPRRYFSPGINNNKEIITTKSFNNSNSNSNAKSKGIKHNISKPKICNTSSINNSWNSIHFESILGKTNHKFFLDKFKHNPKHMSSITNDIEMNEYLKTEPTPTSTANTTNIDSIINHKRSLKQRSYKKMVEIMKKSRFISSSLKSMDVYKNKGRVSHKGNISNTVIGNKHQYNNNGKDKNSFYLSKENTIDNDAECNHNGTTDEDTGNSSNKITYKDLTYCNNNNKAELNADVLAKSYPDYPIAIELNKQMGNIKGYGVNTYKGIVKKDNEDRVSIIQNVPKPKKYKGDWPSCFLLGVYDGHCGKTCANYLKDHLLNNIIKNNSFPNDPIKAIEKGFDKVEIDFLNSKCINQSNSKGNSNSIDSNGNQLIDSSGSCAMVIVIIDTICYIANLGDSRALVSINKGSSYKVLSIEHTLSNEDERKRIEISGGSIYQPMLSLNQFIIHDDVYKNGKGNDHILCGPERVMPGYMTVTRSIGDANAKLPQFGGKSNVILAKPSITSFEITPEFDFIILGSDGLFEQMSNTEVIDAVWLIKTKNTNTTTCINHRIGYTQCVDMLIKTALERNAYDNLTAVLIDLKLTNSSLISNSIEAKGDNNNKSVYETIDQKNCHQRQQKSPSSLKTPSYSVKKSEKNKHIMNINK